MAQKISRGVWGELLIWWRERREVAAWKRRLAKTARELDKLGPRLRDDLGVAPARLASLAKIRASPVGLALRVKKALGREPARPAPCRCRGLKIV